jgi:hypothetical protein
MYPKSEEPMIIELDDPAPRWFRCCGVIAALLFIALLAAPWTMDVETSADPVDGPVLQVPTASYAAVCQPRVELPAFAEPAVSMVLPGWMKLCDWFAEPVAQPRMVPAAPPTDPYRP